MIRTGADAIFKEVEHMVVTGDENPYEAILLAAGGDSEGWMEKYGLAVAEEEKQMMKFWFSLPAESLVRMADHIIEAFLHGFISQSRERGGRRRVRISYHLGQEALAKQVVIRLKERGLLPVVTLPKASLLKAQAGQPDNHNTLLKDLSGEGVKAAIECNRRAMEIHAAGLLDTCGMIGIGQFGRKMPDEKGSRGSSLYYQAEREKEALEALYIKPSEISFCKVAFPGPPMGKGFEELFGAFFELNLMDSSPYELAQQSLIDKMDRCAYIELKGCRENLTNLTVSLFSIADEKRQTKFLNCGGDLNIPFGEVFTTPKLAGTRGLLHVPSICLEGVPYHDLKLWFEDGIVVKAKCSEGAGYVKESLFKGSDYVPAGEFAIGTNTYAYTLAGKFGLEDCLPILISEKTGPHLAIGDSCFARAEDVPVYNMFDNKEMVCRENEASFRNGRTRCYCGFHVDITLPYGQLEYVRGRTEAGETISLIEKGRFALEGAEALNFGLEV